MPVVKIEDILYYVNQARTNPQKFAKYIQQEMNQFKKDNQTLPLVPGCDYSTNQGKAAWIQCKQALQQQKPLPPYKVSQALTIAAQRHADDMSKNNFTGHNSSDGSTLSDRINKIGEKPKYGNFVWGENIGGDFSYKERNHALNSVKGLLIDDGVKSRGHRKNLLSPDFTYIGIGSGIVNGRIRVVMDFFNHDLQLRPDYQLKQKRQGNIETKQPYIKQPQKQKIQEPPKQKFQQPMIKKQVPTQKSQGKYAVSTKKSTSTSTKNGKTTTKTIQTIVYNDGSTQTKETIKTN